MSTASAHCWRGRPARAGTCGVADMAHSRTSAAWRRQAPDQRAGRTALGTQRNVLAAAGGLEPIENGQALGEIEGLVGKVAQAVFRGGRAREQVPLRIAAAELAQLLELRAAPPALSAHPPPRGGGHGA